MQRSIFLLATVCGALLVPAIAEACDGPAGNAVAVSCDGNRCVVTNMSRALLSVAFSAWGQNYSVQLAPGQAGSPVGGGLFGLPMKQYQTCTAIVVPAR